MLGDLKKIILKMLIWKVLPGGPKYRGGGGLGALGKFQS